MKITIVGGTGYTGSAIATEAAKRGHEVASFSRALRVIAGGPRIETGTVAPIVASRTTP